MLEREFDCGIYYIQNNITKQIYIGQSKRLRERRNQHFSHLRKNKHENLHLQNSFNKYGEHSFEYGVIQYCNESELDELEIAYMNLFNVKKHGFNMADGGYTGGYKKEYAHIKFSSFNRHNKRMYALVYQNHMVRSSDISFLEYLLQKYFDDNLYLKEGYCFDDLKKEAKNNMNTNSIQEVRIVKRGKTKKNVQKYSLKYDKQCFKETIHLPYLEYLIDKYFDKNKHLKKGFTIEDIKKERWSDVRKRIETIKA